ncbi:MAG: SpoIID/LytB domain-containing protein [Anaerolineae bacterium]
MAHPSRRRFLAGLAAGAAGALVIPWRGALAHLGSHALSQAPAYAGPLRLASPLTARIEGLVTNMGDEQPLAGALVSADDAITTTGADGRFILNLPAGTYEVRAEAIGFIGMTAVDQRLEEGGVLSLVLEMIPELPTEAQAAVIEAKIQLHAGAINPDDEDTDVLSLAAIIGVPSTIRVLKNYKYPLPDGETQDPPIVETMDLDTYLRGVVPSEMPASWALEALKAQAVAARTYAAVARRHLPDAEICTTTHCQAWYNIHRDSTDQAIAQTGGTVATYNGAMITAFYFAHCIGETRDSEEYPGWNYVAYCRGVTCAPCAERHAAGQEGYDEYYGHGVGMCQVGAAGYAVSPHNMNFVEILKHYYTGIKVESPVLISAPYNGQIVRGAVAVTASTRFPSARVEFYIDDVLKAQVDASPYVAKLSTIGLSNGPHALKVRSVSALDTTEDQITIVVDNTPPSGTASAPTGWQGSTTIPFALSANGSDASYVQFSNNWVWEGENLLHQTGEQVTDGEALNGKAWRAASSLHGAGAWYGPYTCDLPTAPTYQVYYRMKTSTRTPDANIARLDVSDSEGLRVLVEKTIGTSDFAVSDTYEEIPVTFAYTTRNGTCATAGCQNGLEFRTWYLGVRDVTLDRIAVFSAPQALASVIEWEVADREGEQQVTVRFLDNAGNTYDRNVTIKLDYSAPVMTQEGSKSATAQDTASGLNPSSARWSQSTDGGNTWGPWQTLTGLTFAQGTTDVVVLNAPAGAAADVRFSIEDMAGNAAFTRGNRTFLPTMVRNVEG